jgi:hypothetical protein
MPVQFLLRDVPHEVDGISELQRCRSLFDEIPVTRIRPGTYQPQARFNAHSPDSIQGGDKILDRLVPRHHRNGENLPAAPVVPANGARGLEGGLVHALVQDHVAARFESRVAAIGPAHVLRIEQHHRCISLGSPVGPALQPSLQAVGHASLRLSRETPRVLRQRHLRDPHTGGRHARR